MERMRIDLGEERGREGDEEGVGDKEGNKTWMELSCDEVPPMPSPLRYKERPSPNKTFASIRDTLPSQCRCRGVTASLTGTLSRLIKKMLFSVSIHLQH
ncbi:hypothetical protein INR49_013565 [Caranx melampygus]|nr:hypothetical protein INR49_013565 [Caranx melampygus]